MKSSYDYCEALVRERDRERFLSSLFAPADKRRHLFAVYAFDLEIAHITDVVREPMAGEIRLQWWREALAGERPDEARANPVAAALLDTLREYALPVTSFNEMIDVRHFDLVGKPMGSMDALEAYLESTIGGPIAAAVHILDSAGNAGEAPKFAAYAIGIMHLLRSFTRDVQKGRLFLPLDLLASNEVHTATVLAREHSKGLEKSVADLIGIAFEKLAKLREVNISENALPAFLPATLVPIYLSKIEKNRDLFRSAVEISKFRSQFAIWRAAHRGTI